VSSILKEEAKRKKAEKSLRENEVRLKTIFDESPIGIELYKADGTQLTANIASLRMFGISNLAELQNFNLFDGTSLDAEKVEKLRKGMSVAYQTLFDFEKVKKLGQYNTEKKGKAYFDYIITPLLNSHDKKLDGYLVQVQDISDRKRDEEEILILAHALKSVNECVTITDMENKILFVNEVFTTTYGYSADELTGKKINLLRSSENAANFIREILPATLNGGWKGELINVRKNGDEFPIYLSTTVIKDKNKNPIGLIGVASDITERKRKEEELVIAKEKAEESDRLKSAFLANMSHEIRTPMNGILGFAELLKEPELTGEEQKKYIAVIEKSGQRMLNIINDIIDISKIEAGQVKTNIQDTDLFALSEFLFNFFKPEIIKKGLAFYWNIPPENTHLIIKTDKEKVYAILTNLIKNAIKYTQQGSIEFGYVSTGSTTQTPDKMASEVGEWSRTPELQFYVKDTGIGIPKNRQHAIFDRFVQADIEDRKALEGAGLGLAISNAYAKMLGGNIRVESEPGQGSTFLLNLPLQQIPENISDGDIKNEVEKQSPQIKKDFTILIAEDEATSDFYLTEILKTECQQILHAANGAEAVEACRKNPGIDLVLMDIKMPIINGYDASRMIKSINKDIVIVAQTAYALSGDREKALEAGCNDYISKPVKKDLLFSILRPYLTKKTNE
jgi:PAS domain S-box-containing protein